MPRSFVLGNGNLLVGFDANYDVRDLFFPYVGMENQTVGNVCRTGFWIDGKFAWLSDHFEDYVDMVRDYFVRNLRITLARPAEQVRVFFHHDWWMRESDLGCT